MLVSGFLKQSCIWISRNVSDSDPFGKNTGNPQEIRCRWVLKSGWASGLVGDATTRYSSEIMVDKPVKEGDTLRYDGVNYRVVSVKTIIDTAGKEQGRVCYA